MGEGDSSSIMRLARHAVIITVHMFAIAGVAASERGLAGGADFVANPLSPSGERYEALLRTAARRS
jgi:hypothetical protein